MKKLIVALLALSLVSVASPAMADDATGKITGRVFVNGVAADGELGLVAVRLTNSAGELLLGEGVLHGTFKAYDLPADTYTLSFGNYDATPFLDWTSQTIVLAAGEQHTGVVANLTSKPGVPLVSYVDGTIAPNTVTWGKNFKVTGVMRSYGETEAGTIELLHHGKTVQSRVVGSDHKVTFTLDSDGWGNKAGTHKYKVKLTFTGATDVKKAVDYPTFRIR